MLWSRELRIDHCHISDETDVEALDGSRNLSSVTQRVLEHVGLAQVKLVELLGAWCSAGMVFLYKHIRIYTEHLTVYSRTREPTLTDTFF